MASVEVKKGIGRRGAFSLWTSQARRDMACLIFMASFVPLKTKSGGKGNNSTHIPTDLIYNVSKALKKDKTSIRSLKYWRVFFYRAAAIRCIKTLSPPFLL